MAKTITAANASFVITVPGLFDTPVQLRQFSADDIFDTEPVRSGEVMMGVDGVLAAGFTFEPIPQGVSFMANSPSCDLFDQLWQAEQATIEKFAIFGVVILPALSKKWLLNNGYMTTYPPMPNARKTLQPRKFGLTWQQMIASPA